MIAVALVLVVALLGYGVYELNWWITRRQFPELFDGNRWIETPDGLAKCPRCYPKARTA